MRALRAASTSRRTMRGTAAVSWRVDGDTVVEMNVTIPYGATADLRIPLLLDETAHERERRVHIGGCVLEQGQSHPTHGTDAVVPCDAGILGGAIQWQRRLDGELVLALNAVGSGQHAIRVL
jgi:hypothetical protein